MQNIIWLVGKRKTVIPCINLYIFHFTKALNDGKSYWRCSVKTCNVVACFYPTGEVEIKRNHDHSPDVSKVYKAQCFTIIKGLIRSNTFETATSSYEIASRILSTYYNYDSEILPYFPSFSSLKSMIHRIKQEYYTNSALLLSEYLRPDLFDMPNSTNLLLHHSIGLNSMVILGYINFISRFSLQRTFKIYMDGTFKSSPHEYLQLYTIHGEFNGQVFLLFIPFLIVKLKRAIFIYLENCKRYVWTQYNL
ncbi:hypothetical protein NGRA_2821 [Nosema granulosis]|uniref:FLYWCH-type domain-containing protein n=1 Tax=Nosema granulosis TaxID=83296 RepID=A0A9P6GZ47_9MICR|nr:hypothetical protein NGRA_2821 [Nosema granulosis]